MSQKRKQPSTTTTPAAAADPGSQIHTSTPINDRSSKFLALFSTSQPYLSNPRLLQQHTSLTGASHRILAWRKASPQESLTGQLYLTFSDEDGEKWAGKRVVRILGETGVEGVCVVGRWYGGIMLGPVRFEHIERCAREAIGLWKAAQSNEPDAKRVRLVEDDDRVKRQLIQTLKDRDESVRVLRGLLAEKQCILALLRHGTNDDGGGGGGGERSEQSKQTSPAKTQDSYQEMTVTRLRTQEKARDATLAWILRQIEGVEQEIAAIDEGGGDRGDWRD